MMEPTPLRPPSEVVGGFLSLRLGGQDFEVPVLSIAANRQWVATAKEAIGSMQGEIGGVDSLDQILEFVVGQSEAMMDLVIRYDLIGAEAKSAQPVLPDREWLDTHATDGECYAAWKRVTAAAAPLAEEVLHIAPNVMPVLIDAFRKALERGVALGMITIASSRSMSSSPPSTALEHPATSSPASPTSSSPSTPRKPRSGASRKPRPS